MAIQLKMNRSILIGLMVICFLLPGNAYAQRNKYFAHAMIFGTSLTYIWDSDERNNYLHELSWNTNVGITFSKRVFTGIQLLNIYTWGTIEPKESYYIIGLFTQYNFLRGTNHRFFIEVSINRGDYDSYSENSPTRENNTLYLGTGLGYDLPIKFIPKLYLDLSFMHYNILNPFNIDSELTQYIIGLNYRLFEKK